MLWLFMPSFALWSLLGLAVRRKGAVARFLASISGSSIIAITVIAMLGSALSQVKSGSGSAGSAIEGELYVFVAGYYIGSIIGAAATYFWLTKEKR